MKKLSKKIILSFVLILLLLVVGAYFLIGKLTTNEDINYTQSDNGWIKEDFQEKLEDKVISRTVQTAEGKFEQQRIVISNKTTQLSPEDWIATQVDLNDVLILSYEWGYFNGYRHLSVTSQTISDDARIDYFFKNNEVIYFIFQPLHALEDKDTEDYYLRTLSDYLSRQI